MWKRLRTRITAAAYAACRPTRRTLPGSSNQLSLSIGMSSYSTIEARVASVQFSRFHIAEVAVPDAEAITEGLVLGDHLVQRHHLAHQGLEPRIVEAERLTEAVESKAGRSSTKAKRRRSA